MNYNKDSNFIISKAKPIDNTPEKAQFGQRKQIINNTINCRYVAENYYNRGDTDEILFERDGQISKMRQFDYKIYKYLKK